MKRTLELAEHEGRLTASTGLVTIGLHRFSTEHPEWTRANALGASPIMAFSRTPIEAQFEREAPVMLTGAVAATPAAHCRYIRSPRSRKGHDVVWCNFNDPDELARTIAHARPEAQDNPLDPFGRTSLPASPLAGVLTRSLVQRALHTPEQCEPTEIEEAVVRIAGLLTERLGTTPTRSPQPTSTAIANAVNNTAEAIAHQYDAPPSLGELAQSADLSPAYLSRAFRARVGITISEYTGLLRLTEACELLRDPRCSIARAAFAAGFASHAHLSATCKRKLGVTPSDVAAAHREQLHGMLRLVRERTGRAPS